MMSRVGRAPLHDKKSWRGDLHKGDYVAFVLNPASQKNQITIGQVDNTRRDRAVMVHVYRPVLEAIATRWKPIYYTTRDDGDCETLTVAGNPRIEACYYKAIVDKVDLLVEGELNHASNRRLDHRGFRFYYPEGDIAPAVDVARNSCTASPGVGLQAGRGSTDQPLKARFVRSLPPCSSLAQRTPWLTFSTLRR